MESNIAARRRYAKQRSPKSPPHGALSAIETGTRGVSAELLIALEQALNLEPGTITTTYTPRPTPPVRKVVA